MNRRIPGVSNLVGRILLLWMWFLIALVAITLLSIDDHVPERRGTTEVER